RHFGSPGRRLFTLLVEDAHGQLIGIAPWFVETSVRQGRVVRFLGSGEICSDYLTILCLPEHASQVAQRLADWLAHDAGEAWHEINLEGVEEPDPTIAELGRRLAEHGHAVDRRPDLSCWPAELAPTWKDYLSKLSKSRRERTKTLLRRALDSQKAVVHKV